MTMASVTHHYNQQIDMASGMLQTLMLSSTALPIGAYCYSQGIETAIDRGFIHNEQTALNYLQEVLQLNLARCDLPLLLVLQHRFRHDLKGYFEFAALYRASRESKELLAEVQQIAYSFRDWMRDLGVTDAFSSMHPQLDINSLHPYGFLPIFAAFNAVMGQNPIQMLTAYAFSQLENLTLAVVKTVPLGQMAGQRTLWQLLPQIHNVVQGLTAAWATVEKTAEDAARVDAERFLQDVNFSSSLPHLAFMSMQHENLYCRLFRS